jgi:hypothetical protein
MFKYDDLMKCVFSKEDMYKILNGKKVLCSFVEGNGVKMFSVRLEDESVYILDAFKT